MKQEYRTIPDEPLYAIDVDGNVLSYSRYTVPRQLKPARASNGYLTVSLGRKNTRCIHELVALTWIGPRPKNHDVAHKDGNKLNNYVGNLEYKTRTENNYDVSRLDMRTRVTREVAFAIKVELALGITGREIARAYHVSESYVSAIKHGKLRPHG